MSAELTLLLALRDAEGVERETARANLILALMRIPAMLASKYRYSYDAYSVACESVVKSVDYLTNAEVVPADVNRYVYRAADNAVKVSAFEDQTVHVPFTHLTRGKPRPMVQYVPAAGVELGSTVQPEAIYDELVASTMFTETEKRIMLDVLAGKTLSEIAGELGTHVPGVHRQLRAMKARVALLLGRS